MKQILALLLFTATVFGQFDPTNPKIQGVTVLTKTNPVAVGNQTLTGNLLANGATLTNALTVANGGTGTGTAFTAGSVVFAGPSGVYAQDNSQLFWDDTSNRLGIGNSAPLARLNVTATTEQFRPSYDATHYASHTVNSSGNYTIAPSGGGTSITGTLSVSGRLTVADANLDYIAANTFSTGWTVRKRGTTGDANAAVTSGTELGYNNFYGFDGTDWGRGSYQLSQTTENWSVTNHGAKWSLYVTPNGSVTEVLALEVGNDKALSVKGSISVGGGTPIAKAIKATATLDFGNTSAQTSADLTITATGAAVGDPVSLALPASPDANGCFTAWVSAADTVKVRFNNYSSGAIDPASASYTVTVIHY